MVSSKYSQQCVFLMEQLSELVPDEEKIRLREALTSSDGRERCEKWRTQFYDDVLVFAQASTKKRLATKKWKKSHSHFVMLVFYSYRLLEGGQMLLELISASPEHGSYQKVSVHYGLVYRQLLEHPTLELKNSSFFDDLVVVADS